MTKRKEPPTSFDRLWALRKAEEVLEYIAKREGISVEKVRKEIKLAMFAGLVSSDPKAQEAWKQIPCAGDIPTPEELIAYYVLRRTSP